MRIKQLLGILLALSTMITMLSACGKQDEEETTPETTAETQPENSANEKDNQLLPGGLTFGMSYQQAQSTLKDFPSISPADTNNGYFSEKYGPDIDEYYEKFGVDGDTLYEEMIYGNATVLDPGYFFSFNEDKELYEFYVITRILNGESTAEYLFNTYADHLTEHLGQAIKTREATSGMEITFETDTIGASVTLEVDGEDFTVICIVHNKVFELDS